MFIFSLVFFFSNCILKPKYDLWFSRLLSKSRLSFVVFRAFHVISTVVYLLTHWANELHCHSNTLVIAAAIANHMNISCCWMNTMYKKYNILCNHIQVTLCKMCGSIFDPTFWIFRSFSVFRPELIFPVALCVCVVLMIFIEKNTPRKRWKKEE